MYQIMYHSHAGSWAIMLLFFFLAYFFQNIKLFSIITRIFYLIMIVSGVTMLYLLHFPLALSVKGAIALGLISIMELLLLYKKRKQPAYPFWIAFVIDLILVLLLGFKVIQF